ncbi:Histone deacetylase complex subunit [Malassezia cuniculi]|uniref:Histone deacetylase complex subunit n=1 Tax=Malassezia cuniculi TaxID=948313 RepID=A0AAF0J660_9BASI|nr:Histone deacetylase complex subunit [Malassezia cuniculi]
MDVDVSEHDRRTRRARLVKEEQGGTSSVNGDSSEGADTENGGIAHGEHDGADASDAKAEVSGELEYADDDDVPTEGGDEGVTRCVCGNPDENVGLMIQCETCKCWQHCVCMGMHTEEECPDVYYCEQCRPENHIELLRALGTLPPPRAAKRGRNGRASTPKETARELREAKEAVRAIAAANAARLRSENQRRRSQSPRKTSDSRVSRRRGARDSGDESTSPVQEEDEKKRKRAAEQPPVEEPESVGPAELAKRRRMGSEVPQRKERESTPLRRDARKHPNQYTYRKDAAPKRDRRREEGQNDASTSESGRSSLPEHLAHLAYLVPTIIGDEAPPAEPPTDPNLPEPFALSVPLDPTTKIRYPARRMTLGEMRKRVRVIGEYVTRVQIEAVEREKRVRFLGLNMRNEGDVPLSMQLVDQLTRDLNQFQRRFSGVSGKDE